MLNKVHHVAIICSSETASKSFYTEILKFPVIRELKRKEKADILYLDAGNIILELFFPKTTPPKRVNNPEAAGLRHLAFEVDNFDETIDRIRDQGIGVEPVRRDEITNKKMTFFKDPDGLPLEIVES